MLDATSGPATHEHTHTSTHLSRSTKSSGCGPDMSWSFEAPLAWSGRRSWLTGSFHWGFQSVANFLSLSVDTRYWLGNFFHCITSGITSCSQFKHIRTYTLQREYDWLLPCVQYVYLSYKLWAEFHVFEFWRPVNTNGMCVIVICWRVSGNVWANLTPYHKHCA